MRKDNTIENQNIQIQDDLHICIKHDASDVIFCTT